MATSDVRMELHVEKWQLLMDGSASADAQSTKLEYTPEKILRGAMRTGTVGELQKGGAARVCLRAFFWTVLRIHDILVWIRIQILPFSSLTFKTPIKTYLKKSFSAYYYFAVTFTSFFKDKRSKRSHKTVEIKVFLTIFANWLKDPDPWGPKHVDPVDPDSQDCLWIINFLLFLVFELLECR